MRKLLLAIALLLLPVSTYAGELNLGYNSFLSSAESRGYHVDASESNDTSYVSFDWNYGKTEDIVTSDNMSLDMGYDPKISDKWSLWFFNKAGYNNVREINFEDQIGAGPKYTFIDNDMLDISLSAGIIWHYKDQYGEIENTKRYSIRPKGEYTYKRFKGKYVLFYQPDMGKSNDYITINQVSLGYMLSGSIGLSVYYEDEYRSNDKENRYERMMGTLINVNW